jgi:acyl carrier protein
VMADQRSQPEGVPLPEVSADALLEVIQTVARELHPHRQSLMAAGLDSALERELGFDSLGRVELWQRVERAFGVQLPDLWLTTAETPRDLLRALTTAGARSRLVDARPAKTRPLAEVDTPPIRAGTLVEVLEWHVQAHPTARISTSTAIERWLTKSAMPTCTAGQSPSRRGCRRVDCNTGRGSP